MSMMRWTVLVGMALTACGAGVGPGGFGTCEQLVNGFVPCGGDVTGQWQAEETCEAPLPAQEYVGDLCPDVTGEVFVDYEMTLRFDGATLTQQFLAARLTASALFSPECVAATAGDCPSMELVLADRADQVTCRDEGGACRCDLDGDLPVNNDPQAFPYEIQGTALVVEADITPFCVRGDELVINFGDEIEPLLTRFGRL